ncbi:hypothetical protein BBJ29_003288 [Phytophthora kernoviae]|uniref:Uncharacterized protein n=1 Tax=Phytophthora kernoviae TaxID=325452 RepID=A0A3F2RUQ0_9STRA|nr:hypothetical protein BBP00_00003388 [Phytophthora kernoviae]RLN68806.1 hypothetical protein BBJ29_003288 [Phytophthora kernoviae]
MQIRTRSPSSVALLLLITTLVMKVAAKEPELVPIGDVLNDQEAIPGPFTPENQEALANLVGESEGLFTGTTEDALLPGEGALIAAEPQTQPDKFFPMDERNTAVLDLVNQFMGQYEDEVGRTSLKASVLQVLKAEKTEPREETQEIEIGTGGEDAIELVENGISQLIRVYLLVNYGFQTKDLECDILEHVDLPRTKGSTQQVGSAIQHEIANVAPASFLQNHTLKVQYDAVEMQDITMDTENDIETMTYVRFRVADSSGQFSEQDCMVVILQARGINTLMYTDSVCFDSASKSAVLSAYEYASNNLPVGALIVAAFCGAIVGAVLLIRHRRKNQRYGYSYVRSKVPSHVPSQTESGVKYIDSTSPATAC